MARKRKSTVEQIREERKPVEQAVTALADTVEVDEKALLSKLKKKYENQAVSGEQIPGQTVRGQKVSWTYNEMLKRFPVATFTPEETVPLTWNGVKVQARAGIEMHVPQPFQDLYWQHRRLTGKIEVPPDIEVGAGLGPLEAR